MNIFYIHYMISWIKKKFVSITVFFAIAALIISFPFFDNSNEGIFIDKRNDKTYKYVKIGKQYWMTENLNYNVAGSKCYNNELAGCEKYGRLYSWKSAMSGACPEGWHLPSDAEWTELTDYIGSITYAGIKLKSKYGWDELTDNGESGNGTDDYDFAALPSGYGYINSFYDIGNYGYWWSATENDSQTAYYRDVYYDHEDVGRDSYDKTYLLSIRCVK